MALVLASLLFLAQAESTLPPFWPIPWRPSPQEYERRAASEPGRLADEMQRNLDWERKWGPIIESIVNAPRNPQEHREQILEDMTNAWLEYGGVDTPRKLNREALQRAEQREEAEIGRLRERQRVRDGAEARRQGLEPPAPLANPPASPSSPPRADPAPLIGDTRPEIRGEFRERPANATRIERRPDQLANQQAEAVRAETERAQRERVERERAEKERADRERAEKERIEAERERLHTEGLSREQAERERRQREEAEKQRREREEAERRRLAEEERQKKERANPPPNVPVPLERPVNPDFDVPSGNPIPPEPELDPCAFAICLQDAPAGQTSPDLPTPICWEAICRDEADRTVLSPVQRLDRCAYAICVESDGEPSPVSKPKPVIDPATIRRGPGPRSR